MRIAFWITVLLAGGTVWLAPHLPLADLAQHAAQVALCHDLLLGTSRWQGLAEVNYFTPYWLGFGLALLLSFLVPVSAALKIVLMLSYWGFVAGSVLLRRRLDADPRVDWLSVTPFFGLGWLYGFFPFLVALPIAMAFIVLAQSHAHKPTLRRAFLLVVLGVLLFFSHGLVFVFAVAVAAAFLVIHRPSPAAVLPYLLLGLVSLAYFLLRPAATTLLATRADWLGLGGLSYVAFFPMGSPAIDPLLAPLVPLLLAASWLLGGRFNRNKAAVVPIAMLLLWIVLVPETVMETYFVGSRFAVFFLPFVALLFASAPAPGWRLLPIALLTWWALGVQVERLLAFAAESRAFEEVLAAAEPGHRAQQQVLDMTSRAARTPMAYQNFALWYQAEKAGFVDFNFAAYPTQVVRFRDPKAQTELPASAYRYVFVRGAAPQAVDCPWRPRKASGPWTLLENVGC
ncbi:MAG: hypothetical protein J0J01_25690 [Reyranella sp.]|uniref:hypothetical protein n=1 Tax=Reyranella sp. TaxID=1929291 RepID=UPI001AD3843B|nr:hypothetical protein [Reyranella sp.]MBN9090319.1 hypothetical protein [Reyranella sp.]